MHKPYFMIFITVFGLTYLLFAYYIYRRSFAKTVLNKAKLLKIIYWASTLLFPVTQLLKHRFSLDLLYLLGVLWLGLLFFVMFGFLIKDILKILARLFRQKPALDKFVKQLKITPVVLIYSISIILVIIGHFNAKSVTLREYLLSATVNNPQISQVKIAFVSDIHLGLTHGVKSLHQLTQILNEQKPDLIIIGGDLVDGDLGPLLEKNLYADLQKISAPLGVYGVMGNHEYIMGFNHAKDFFKRSGITPLIDSCATIAGTFMIAGRNDYSSKHFGGEKRNPLVDIIGENSSNLPVIVVDHQPVNLPEVAQSGALLFLAGHTHSGQLWPLNYLAETTFGVKNGPSYLGETFCFVSNGYGTWGPPLRIGNRAEVAMFTISFAERVGE